MKIGIVFPQTEIGSDPAVIREFGQTAEALGFDYLMAYDHVLGANPNRPGGWTGPYTYQNPFHEIFVLFSYLAGITQRIEFVSGILILPQRQTALVAKQAASLDVLSNGRLRLGVAVGWNKVEYDGLGMDFSKRGKRSGEQVRLLKRLWTEPLVDFDGEFDSIPDAGIAPMPVQQPIPVWFGGGADAALRRMAELGDGWIPNFMTVAEGRKTVETLHGYLRDAGRDPQDFGMDVRAVLTKQSRKERADFIKGWAKLGMTHISMDTMRAGLSPAEHIQAMKDWREELRELGY